MTLRLPTHLQQTEFMRSDVFEIQRRFFDELIIVKRRLRVEKLFIR